MGDTVYRFMPVGKTHTNKTAQCLMMRMSGGNYLTFIYSRVSGEVYGMTHHTDIDAAYNEWQRCIYEVTPGGYSGVQGNRRRGLRARIRNANRECERLAECIRYAHTDTPKFMHEWEAPRYEERGQEYMDGLVAQWQRAIERYEQLARNYSVLLNSGRELPHGTDLDWRYFGSWAELEYTADIDPRAEAARIALPRTEQSPMLLDVSDEALKAMGAEYIAVQ